MSPALPTSSSAPALAPPSSVPRSASRRHQDSVGPATGHPHDPTLSPVELAPQYTQNSPGDVSTDPETDDGVEDSLHNLLLRLKDDEIADLRRRFDSTLCQLADVLDDDSKLKEMIAVLEEHKTLTSKRMQPFEEQEAARRAVEHKKAIQQRDDLYIRLAPSGRERLPSVASDTLSDTSVSLSELIMATEARLPYDADASLRPIDLKTETVAEMSALRSAAERNWADPTCWKWPGGPPMNLSPGSPRHKEPASNPTTSASAIDDARRPTRIVFSNLESPAARPTTHDRLNRHDESAPVMTAHPDSATGTSTLAASKPAQRHVKAAPKSQAPQRARRTERSLTEIMQPALSGEEIKVVQDLLASYEPSEDLLAETNLRLAVRAVVLPGAGMDPKQKLARRGVHRELDNVISRMRDAALAL